MNQVSYYEQSQKFVRMAITLVTSAGVVIMPRMTNYIKSKEWDKFEIDKDFRGCKLHITVHNPGHVESGFKKMIVNREELGENYIPQEKLTEITEVELFMS